MSGEIDNEFDINLDVQDESVDVDSSFNAQEKQDAIVKKFFEMGDSGEFYLKEKYFKRCSDYFENLFSVQPKNDEDWDSDYWDQHNRVMKGSSVELRTYFEKKRFVIHGEIEDRDWYSGNHELQFTMRNAKLNLTVTLSDETATSTSITVVFNLAYRFELNVTDDDINVKNVGGRLNGNSEFIMIPDGNHPGFPNCYYFFGGGELGNEDSKSGPDQYFSKDGDKLDGCDFDLKLYPVFFVDVDASINALSGTLPKNQLTSAIPTQTNTQRHIEYTTSNNHGFSVGTKVNIHGCTPDYFNARLVIESVTSQNSFIIDFSEVDFFPDTDDDGTPDAIINYGYVSFDEDSLNQFLDNIDGDNSQQLSDQDLKTYYEDIIMSKFENAEVFKIQSKTIGDKGKLVSWINEQLGILNLPSSMEPDKYDQNTYKGVIGLKKYFYGLNPALYDVLELDTPCGCDIIGHETLTQEHCQSSDPNAKGCGCYTFGCVVFQEIIDFHDDTSPPEPTRCWDLLTHNSSNLNFSHASPFQPITNPAKPGGVDIFGQYSKYKVDPNESAYRLIDVEDCSFTVKRGWGIYLRVSLVDYTNPNSPLELQSGFTNYGNFVDYVLDSDIEFNISRKTNGDYEISWSYKSGDHTGRSLCLTDNLVTSHISYRNTTTRVRIEIRDVRSTLGEWANSGTSSLLT